MVDAGLVYEESKRNMHNMYSEAGMSVYKAVCSSYPEYTRSEKADFPRYYREHIEVFEDYWLSL